MSPRASGCRMTGGASAASRRLLARRAQRHLGLVGAEAGEASYRWYALVAAAPVLCTPALHLASRSMVYHEAIAWGAAGAVWGLVFPINKNLWTSSYAVFMAGWALLALIATERGLYRLDGSKLSQLKSAPRRVDRLVSERWAIHDRAAVDLKTGTRIRLPQGLPITGKIHSLQPQRSWEPIIMDLSIRGAA